MAELIDVVNALFKDRNKWKEISDGDKERNFFICNRYFSKKFPQKAQLLNNKFINKVTAMDIWYFFMQEKTYPKWFWSKSSSKQKSELNNDEISYLMNDVDLKIEDIEILMKYYPDIIKEEIKYYKSVKKSSKE